MIDFGFPQSYEDYSLVMFTKGRQEMRILIYVDDLVLASNDVELLNQVKAHLSKCFRMKDLGKLKYLLGIEVARAAEGIFLPPTKVCFGYR